MKSEKTSWGAVAEWYDDLIENGSDSFQEKILKPNLLRLVEPKAGMTVIDVACGQGFMSRSFDEKGASVIGCDISPELIAIAKKNSPADIDFHTAPADDLSFLPNNSSDVAVIVLALQNIENMAGALAECARVLKSGGRLIVVINHPTFRIPQASAWQWDEKNSKQYRRIDGYMSDRTVKIDMTPGEKEIAKKKFTVSFHRPLQSYFKALAKSGLAVTRLEEWISHKKSEDGPRGPEEDRMRKEIPLFLCIEAKKISAK